MIKKLIATGAILSTLAIGGVAFAQTSGTTTPPATTTTPAVCVGTAVNAREATIDAAVTTFTQEQNIAFASRATALQAAYALTAGNGAIKSAVKSAWSTFNASMKAARGTLRSAKLAAWKTERAAAKTCRASTSISDASQATADANN